MVLYVAIAQQLWQYKYISCFVHASYVARGPARAPLCLSWVRPCTSRFWNLIRLSGELRWRRSCQNRADVLTLGALQC